VLILGVTTSTAAVGVAVWCDDEVLSVQQVRTDRRHAEELTPMLAQVLADAGVEVSDIDRLAVDVGPGRFTGMRVGLATVRALAFAVDCPVVGITSLELLAAAVPERPVVAVIDARRNEVFQQAFSETSTGPARVGTPSSLMSDVPDHALVVGDGADRYRDLYAAAPGAARILADQDPQAAILVRLAASRVASPGRTIEPVYLRDPDVQINIKTRPNETS
jgi:tRNA threonylcarbamoyladenosine biosynthesis protein TsaB